MARNGKIARLPETIRVQLNQRLDDGQEGETILPWLNALPEVQQSLKQHFDAAPITKQNLSEWHQGGFREWKIRDYLLDHAGQIYQSADRLEAVVEPQRLVGYLAAMLATRYAALLNTWDGQPDENLGQQLRFLRLLNQDLALLQKTCHHADRQVREHVKDYEEGEDREEQKMREATLNVIRAKLESQARAEAFGGGPGAHKLAEFMTAVKYGLPDPEWAEADFRESLRRRSQPKPEQEKKKDKKNSPPASTQPQPPSSPAQSNPVAPKPPRPTPSDASHSPHEPQKT